MGLSGLQDQLFSLQEAKIIFLDPSLLRLLQEHLFSKDSSPAKLNNLHALTKAFAPFINKEQQKIVFQKLLYQLQRGNFLNLCLLDFLFPADFFKENSDDAMLVMQALVSAEERRELVPTCQLIWQKLFPRLSATQQEFLLEVIINQCDDEPVQWRLAIQRLFAIRHHFKADDSIICRLWQTLIAIYFEDNLCEQELSMMTEVIKEIVDLIPSTYFSELSILSDNFTAKNISLIAFFIHKMPMEIQQNFRNIIMKNLENRDQGIRCACLRLLKPNSHMSAQERDSIYQKICNFSKDYSLQELDLRVERAYDFLKISQPGCGRINHLALIGNLLKLPAVQQRAIAYMVLPENVLVLTGHSNRVWDFDPGNNNFSNEEKIAALIFVKNGTNNFSVTSKKELHDKLMPYLVGHLKSHNDNIDSRSYIIPLLLVYEKIYRDLHIPLHNNFLIFLEKYSLDADKHIRNAAKKVYLELIRIRQFDLSASSSKVVSSILAILDGKYNKSAASHFKQLEEHIKNYPDDAAFLLQLMLYRIDELAQQNRESNWIFLPKLLTLLTNNFQDGYTAENIIYLLPGAAVCVLANYILDNLPNESFPAIEMLWYLSDKTGGAIFNDNSSQLRLSQLSPFYRRLIMLYRRVALHQQEDKKLPEYGQLSISPKCREQFARLCVNHADIKLCIRSLLADYTNNGSFIMRTVQALSRPHSEELNELLTKIDRNEITTVREICIELQIIPTVNAKSDFAQLRSYIFSVLMADNQRKKFQPFNTTPNNSYSLSPGVLCRSSTY